MKLFSKIEMFVQRPAVASSVTIGRRPTLEKFRANKRSKEEK